MQEHPTASSGTRSNAVVSGPPRVVHIITSLEVGGAERALVRLVRGSASAIDTVAVVSLAGRGPLATDLEAVGVPVFDVGLHGARDVVFASRRLLVLLRRLDPDVVHTWMHHADLIGGLVARAAHVRAVAWNLRASALAIEGHSLATRALTRLNALLSRWIPDVITCVAEAARRDHARIGYASRKMVVVPNGIAEPDVPPTARQEVRRELGIGPGVPLVGRVGRFHPMKDHSTLVRAAGRLRYTHPDIHWLLCGAGVTDENPALRGWLDAEGVSDRVHLLGPRDDIDRLHAALDIACSSSAHSEGFPGVVAEAMACGVPVVATDVGDSANIVGGTGRVVPPGDPDALASAIAELIDDDDLRRRCGAAARLRVLNEFGIERMVERYRSVYESIL